MHDGPAPEAGPPTPIHRDYHPGNVLWEAGRVSGVVDWPCCASLGAPEVDVDHCRANLHGRFGPEATDRFLELYQAMARRSGHHPYRDIAAAFGPLSGSGRQDWQHWPARTPQASRHGGARCRWRGRVPAPYR